MAETIEWRNRIIEHGVKPASQFMAHPSNWRKHPVRQRKALKGSLDSLGWVAPVLENRRTGYLIDGHERVWQALQNGDAPVPYIVVDLDESEEAQALLSLDAIAALAQTDAGKVDELLKVVDTANEDVQQFLADMAKDAGLDYGQPPQEAPEPQIDKAAELQEKWQTATGQLWEIPSKSGNGVHRLLCGDCTKVEDVARVMAGEKADMGLSDPPYALMGNSTGVSNITDDKMVMPFFREIFKMFRDFTKVFAHIYLCCDWHSAFAIESAARDIKVSAKNLCIWDKGDGGVGAMYQQCYELVWFFTNSPFKSTLGHSESGERTVNGVPNIWRVSRQSGTNRLHGAQKPVELFEIPITHGCDKGDVVLDAFLGSGTTIVACERLSRLCRAIEISPAYVAVSLQRLADMGLEPRLVA